MQAKVLKEFTDLRANVLRRPEETFEITEERAQELESNLLKFGPGPWFEISTVVDDKEPESEEVEAPEVEVEVENDGNNLKPAKGKIRNNKKKPR